jgi:hypothetical protein
VSQSLKMSGDLPTLPGNVFTPIRIPEETPYRPPQQRRGQSQAAVYSPPQHRELPFNPVMYRPPQHREGQSNPAVYRPPQHREAQSNPAMYRPPQQREERLSRDVRERMERDYVASPSPIVTTPDRFEFTFENLANLFENSKSFGSVEECHQLQMTQKHVTTENGVWVLKVCRYISSDALGIASNAKERQGATTASELKCGAAVYQNGAEEGDEDGILVTYTYIFMERLPVRLEKLLFTGVSTKKVDQMDRKARFFHEMRMNSMPGIVASLEQHLMDLYNKGNIVHLDLSPHNIRVRTHENPMDTRQYMPIEFANPLFIDFGRILRRETIESAIAGGTDITITFHGDVKKTVFKAPIKFSLLMSKSTDDWSGLLQYDIDRFQRLLGGELQERLAYVEARIDEEMQSNIAMTLLKKVIVGETLEFVKNGDRYELQRVVV